MSSGGPAGRRAERGGWGRRGRARLRFPRSPADPDRLHAGCTGGLKTVAGAWPHLPDPIKAAVVALVSPLPDRDEGARHEAPAGSGRGEARLPRRSATGADGPRGRGRRRGSRRHDLPVATRRPAFDALARERSAPVLSGVEPPALSASLQRLIDFTGRLPLPGVFHRDKPSVPVHPCCPVCGAMAQVRKVRRRFGSPFWRCSRWPKCSWANSAPASPWRLPGVRRATVLSAPRRRGSQPRRPTPRRPSR
jgi:hypothetical protein